MSKARLLTVQGAEWPKVLERLPHDVYHQPGYVRICAQRERGDALAVHVTGPAGELFLPLIRHTLPAPWLHGWNDVTSPYGYAGPLVGLTEGATASDRDDFLPSAIESLCDLLLEERVATAFLRFNPAMPLTMRPFARAGQLVLHGHTVALDLREDESVLWRGVRANHRSGIRRGERRGHRVVRDAEWEHLDEFVAIYRETMDRVGAASTYYFDRSYFEALRSAVGKERLHLFVVKDDERTLAGALFAETDGVVQYHLGGTHTADLKWQPHKLLYWTVALWAKGRQNRMLHLGGGLGGREDSLFHFKAGFSDARLPFYTWRKILNAELVDSMLASLGLQHEDSDFFPAYRQSRAPL
jgi:hypothetical protein